MLRLSPALVLILVVLVVGTPRAEVLTGFGGDGGNKYGLDCGRSSVLVGLEARYGDFMDSVEILCRKIDANGQLGKDYAAGRAGGNGGQLHCKLCPASSVVSGMAGGYGRYINSIILICSTWDAKAKAPTSNIVARIEFAGSQAAPKRMQDGSCKSGNFASGLFVWAGAFVDFVSLVCDPYEP